MHHLDPDFLVWVEQRSKEYVGLAPVPSAPAFEWLLAPGALALARACVDLLSTQNRLSDAWKEAALARPEHLSFQIAARECIESLPKEPQLALLRTALDSSARSGEAAAEAAGVLAHHGRLQPSDPRVGAIFARVHGEPRRDLLFHLLERQTDVRPLRAPRRTLLLSEDLDDAYFVIDHLLRGRKRPGVNELLRETLPAIRTGLMRTLIEKHLRLPSEVERFWQDTK